MRLLLVEDNVPLADELTQSLQRQGYAPTAFSDPLFQMQIHLPQRF